MNKEHEILLDVLNDYRNADKWDGAVFGQIKRMSNTHIGKIGETYVENLCRHLGIATSFPTHEKEGTRRQRSPWDIKIHDIEFEIKTATEDVHQAFQFNHIRHHREYEALLCMGIAPDDVFFGVWTKADVVTGKAGTLVTMDKGSSATFKLTKKREEMLDIKTFEKTLRDFSERYALQQN